MQKEFLFSLSTNAFQVEGGRSLHGRTDSIWDWFTKTNYHIPPTGSTKREINSIEISSDLYHKYKSDVKIMKNLGINSLIYCLDWTRLFPKDENFVNPMGVQFYDNFFKELCENGIKPIPILFHWDTPLWLEIKGGWCEKYVLDAFRNYCAAVFKYLGKYSDIWFVNDENKTFMLDGYLGEAIPPGYKSVHKFATALHNLVVGAAIAKEEFQKAKDLGYVSKEVIIGIDDDWSPPIVFDNSEENKEDLIKNYNIWMRDLWIQPNLLGIYPNEFLDFLKMNNINANIVDGELDYIRKYTLDFIGWNFYRPYFIADSKKEVNPKLIYNKPLKLPFGEFQIVLPRSHKKYTKWLWPIAPEYLEIGLKAYKENYDLPIMIVENGFGDFDLKSNEMILDYDRLEYLQPILESVSRCRELDLNLFGYSLWTYCDIFSPSAGYRKDYGIISVDFNSPIKERKPKLSYCWYKQVIESNGVNTSIDKTKLERDLKNILRDWNILWK